MSNFLSLIDIINILLTLYVVAVFCETGLWLYRKLRVRYLLRQERAFLARWYADEEGEAYPGYSMADSINLGIVRRKP